MVFELLIQHEERNLLMLTTQKGTRRIFVTMVQRSTRRDDEKPLTVFQEVIGIHTMEHFFQVNRNFFIDITQRFSHLKNLVRTFSFKVFFQIKSEKNLSRDILYKERKRFFLACAEKKIFFSRSNFLVIVCSTFLTFVLKNSCKD